MILSTNVTLVRFVCWFVILFALASARIGSAHAGNAAAGETGEFYKDDPAVTVEMMQKEVTSGIVVARFVEIHKVRVVSHEKWKIQCQIGERSTDVFCEFPELDQEDSAAMANIMLNYVSLRRQGLSSKEAVKALPARLKRGNRNRGSQ